MSCQVCPLTFDFALGVLLLLLPLLLLLLFSIQRDFVCLLWIECIIILPHNL